MKTKLTTTIPPKSGPVPQGLNLNYNTVKGISRGEARVVENEIRAEQAAESAREAAEEAGDFD